MSLRQYQINAINKIRNHYSRGIKKVLLHSPVGSGKTVIFCEIVKQTIANGKKCLIVTRGRQLVDQASERLAREGVSHGVLMSGHYRYDLSKAVQVISIDTANKRKIYPDAELIILDECHYATSKTFIDFLNHYEDKFFLGVSATPYSEKSLSHIAQVVVETISVKELVSQGFLSQLRYWAPRTPELSNIKMVGGDFDLEQLSKEMQRSLLVGDIVSEWENHAKGTPTLCFAVDVAHSKTICDAFQNRGINAVHVDAMTDLNLRKIYINKLETGEISILVNCGVFVTGCDIPHIKTIILARPTKSYVWHIQALGRGTRTSPGKEFCRILDHAGNVQRHGFVDEPRHCDLDQIDKKEIRQSPITCRHCFGVFMFQDVEQKGICPLCGQMFTASELKKARELKQVDGELVEIKELTKDEQAMRDLREWKKERKVKGYKRGWLYWKCITKYGPDMAARLIPKRNVPDWIKGK